MFNLLKRGFPLLFVFTILFCIVLFINFFKYDIDKDICTTLYYSVLCLGYSFAFAIIPYFLIYIPISLVKRKSDSLQSYVYTAICILIMILLVIDSFVFSIYKYHINLSLITWFLDAGSDVFVFDIKLKIQLIGLLILSTILPFTLVCIYRNKIARLSFFKPKCISYIILVLFSFSILSNILYVLARKQNNSDYIKVAECIPLFQSKILNKVVRKWNFAELDDIDHTMYYVPLKEMHYPLSTIVTNDSIPGYNVVMILIDSWSIRSFDEETTPSIFEFAQTAQQFKEHYSGANATIGGVFSIFYSLPYSYHYPAEASKSYPLFFEQLKKFNYEIGIFSSANLVLESTVFGGLKNLRTSTPGNNTLERDTQITDDALKFIKDRDSGKPFFSFLFYDLAHAISIPEPYRKQFTPSWDEPNYLALSNDMDPTPFFNLYRNCVYYIDSQIKRVLDELEAQNLMDNTIIIISGDHGQEFNESKRNNWGHFSNYSKWQIQIPFILHDPSMKKESIQHDYVTTHYDIAPTLLHNFLGVENAYQDYAIGKNLYDQSSRYPFWSGDFIIRTSLVFEDVLTTVEHGPAIINVTDRDLKPLPRSIIEDRKQQFIDAQKDKERFY